MRKRVRLCCIVLLLFLMSCGTNENTSTPEERIPSQSPALSPTTVVFDYTPTPTVTLSKIRPEQPELSDSDASKAVFGNVDFLNPQEGCTSDGFYEEYRKRKVNFHDYCYGYGYIGVTVRFDFEEQNGDINAEEAICLEKLRGFSYSTFQYDSFFKVLYLELSFEEYSYENLVKLLSIDQVKRVWINHVLMNVDGYLDMNTKGRLYE